MYPDYLINNLKFNKNGEYFDVNLKKVCFYENIYIKENPTLHIEDSQDKVNIISEAIKYLIEEYSFIPKRIIDAGAGGQIILRKVIDNLKSKTNSNIDGLAIDISSSILKHSPKYKDICKLRADITNLPLKSNTFDLLLMIDLLEHTKNPEKVIKESLRVSKYVIIKTPLEKSLYTQLKGGKSRLNYLKNKYGHIHHFDFSMIQKILHNNKIVWLKYMKIPNRYFIIDKLQDFLLKYKLYKTFRFIFGGFILIILTQNNETRKK